MAVLRIGRYGVTLVFSRTYWLQTQVPTKFRRFLCFLFLKEARPTDIDKKQDFPMNTKMENEGRVYRYWKMGHTTRKEDMQ